MLGKTIESRQLEKKKRKKWPYVIGFFMILSIIFIGLLFWINETVKSPNSNVSDKKSIVIVKGTGIQDIAKDLKSQNLLKNDFVFVLYLKYKGFSGKIQAGDYQIPGNLNMIELAEIITSGKIITNKVTIPEGWTKDQIADRLEKTTKISRNEFLDAITKEYNYGFLTDKPKDADLEGYLYPDTYILSANPTADELLKKMLDNFDKKFTSDLRAKAAGSNMNIHEIVTLASIVEREVANAEDRKIVAGIFLNRLNNDMPLESCATIQYILKSDKKQFTYEETRVESLYNTYINKGLPKGPIGNPSIMAIEAVLSPTKTDYFFFLTGNDGKTYFSKTLEEHNAKKIKYLP